MRCMMRGSFGNIFRSVITAATVIPVIFMAASNLWAHSSLDGEHRHIEGDPLDIVAYDNGQMEVWFEDVCQYFGYYNSNNWGSILMFRNGELFEEYADAYHSDSGNGPRIFTSVSNTKPIDNPWEIDTVLAAGMSGMTVAQKVQYTNTYGYYRMTWTITNTSTATYTDCRFIHGGDAHFAGNDKAQSYWDENLGMVYLKNEGVSGLMGFYGGIGSRVDRFVGAHHSDGLNEALSGWLSNTVKPDFYDAEYYLQWNRASLAPGESWTITAFEKWTDAGNIQVLAPPDQTITKGETLDLVFTVQNFQSMTDTLDLGAQSDLGWPLSLPYGNTVSLSSGQSTTVTVRVAPPSGSDTSVDTVTLTATSQADASIFNSDSVNVTGTPNEDDGEVTPEEPEDTGPYRHHNDYCFVSTAGASNALVLIFAAAVMGCLFRSKARG